MKTKAQITKLPQIVATNKQFICLYNSCSIHIHTDILATEMQFL